MYSNIYSNKENLFLLIRFGSQNNKESLQLSGVTLNTALDKKS